MSSVSPDGIDIYTELYIIRELLALYIFTFSHLGCGSLFVILQDDVLDHFFWYIKGVEKKPPRLIFDILKVKFDLFRHIFEFGSITEKLEIWVWSNRFQNLIKIRWKSVKCNKKQILEGCKCSKGHICMVTCYWWDISSR